MGRLELHAEVSAPKSENPPNLLIGEKTGWNFIEFFIRMSPVTIPVLIVGFLTCVLVERFRWLGYGFSLPPSRQGYSLVV